MSQYQLSSFISYIALSPPALNALSFGVSALKLKLFLTFLLPKSNVHVAYAQSYEELYQWGYVHGSNISAQL